MTELDALIFPFTGVLICQFLACGYMYSKLRRRIRELESLLGEGRTANEQPVPSAPVEKGEYVVVPLEITGPQSQYIGGVTFTPVLAQGQPYQQGRHWRLQEHTAQPPSISPAHTASRR